MANVAIDPVCGMEVKLPSEIQLKNNGQTYSFCSVGCKNRFESDPEKYLAEKDEDIEPPHHGHDNHQVGTVEHEHKAGEPGDAGYTCPMHPEEVKQNPGSCTKCGMALEPSIPTQREKIEYTCPMHPEIVQDGPGNCPVCGMALEPRTVTTTEEDNPELRDMTRRFRISVLLSIHCYSSPWGVSYPPFTSCLTLWHPRGF